MIGSIIGAIIVGAIIGALARLIMPGKQNIGVIMTILLGIVGGLAGSAITSAFGYHNEKGIAWIPFIVGIVVAIILIAIYVAVTGRGTTARRP